MTTHDERVSTGCSGLDDILRGGLPAHRLYLLEGAPGSGKTTLALQFLMAGRVAGERVLYVTLSETEEELLAVARSHGWDLNGIDIFELSNASNALEDQSVLHPWEVELSAIIQLIREKVLQVRATRVVFDSLSELRLLAQDPLRYRRQVLALKQFFAPHSATVVLIDDLTADLSHDTHLHSLCHGVITLERLTLDFGPARRHLQIQKLRGVNFVAGFHDFTIETGGVAVFPRLIASEHSKPFVGDYVSSGVAQIDALLGGGPRRGTSTLFIGPAGAGKTTLALQYLSAACARGEACALFEFDERVGTLIARAEGLGLGLQRHLDSGLLTIRQIDPAVISPGEFACAIQKEVETRQVRLVVVDSLNGYIAAMPQEKQLILQMHEMLAYLNQSGVLTLLINPQHGLVGSMSSGDLNVSYIADTVVLLRFFEEQGRLRKAISVVKNRSGLHEDTIRELRVDAQGVRVGEPLSDFRGVLTGTPQYMGSPKPLMEDRGA